MNENDNTPAWLYDANDLQYAHPTPKERPHEDSKADFAQKYFQYAHEDAPLLGRSDRSSERSRDRDGNRVRSPRTPRRESENYFAAKYNRTTRPTRDIKTYLDDELGEDESTSWCAYCDCGIIVLEVYHFLCILVAIAAIFANFYAISQGMNRSDLKDDIIRGFAILLCIQAIIIEFDWAVLTKYFKIYHYWFFRGLLYAFIGVLTVRTQGSLIMFENLAGVVLIVIAIIYIMMAITCVRSIYQRRKQRDSIDIV